MRITEGMIASDYLTSVNRTRSEMVKLQSDLATGKRVLKPSDDPLAADTILRINGSIDQNEQYQKNVSEGQSMMEMTSSSLDSFTTMLINAKTLVTRASSGAQQDSWGSYADQLDELLGEAVDIANTQNNGKYLFGGTQTLTPPFTLAADRSAVTANPAGIAGDINCLVGEGLTQKMNIDGQTAFQGTQIFSTIIRLRDALRSGNPVSQADIDALTSQINGVTSAAGTAGAILQNMDTVSTHLGSQNTQLKSLLSLQQDTDVAEATLQLKQDETMLNAALSTGAQIIPKSLVDYLS